MEQQLPFGEWLRQRRIAIDLTQWELAARIGCSRSVIQKMESGARRPSKQVAELLARCLGVASEDRDNFVTFARLGCTATPPISVPVPATASPQSSTQPAASSPTTHLPALLTSFIGRETEIEAVRLSPHLLHWEGDGD